MEVNSNLPVLVPAVTVLIVASVAAGLALAWNRQARFQRLVRRLWLATVIITLAGAVIFWVSTALIEGPSRAPVDRSLQVQQQDELRQRLQKGGH
jgi:hypothetical protein